MAELTRRDLLTAAAAATAGAIATPVRAAESEARWDASADVVIVGFGAAGASAAIDARAAGASVRILERAARGGGTSALAGGILYMGGGTPLQKALGYPDSPQEMVKYLMAASGPGPDAEKIRAFCERSVEHYLWTVARGVSFKESFYTGISLPLTDDGLFYSGSELAYPYSEIARPAPRGHKPQILGEAGGGLLMQKLTAAALEAGAELVAGALCEGLVQASDGRVVGVVASAGGEERHFRAQRGVILAAGGFCHDRAMVERYAPLYLACDTPIGAPGDDGRGIRMGVGAGGAAVRMDSGFAALPFHPPEGMIEGILIDAQGDRFINEDSYYGRTGDAIIRNQGAAAILIVDAGCPGKPKYADPPLLGEAGTIAELEAMIGLPEPALQNTVSVYNRYAAQGADPRFHKTERFLRVLDRPPFRALDCSAKSTYYPFFTLGGLHTRVGGEVLEVNGDAVPGLYAAGRTTSGVAALGYSSGISLTDASFFGRLAGRGAAAAPG
jgi:succinate dehydrogenase/fumarate reductase flavoprotein subunit